MNALSKRTGGARRGWVMVFGPKGGVGKTTTTYNLLVSAANEGQTAIGVDFDAQKSLSLWAEDRGARPDSGTLTQVSIFTGNIPARDRAYAMAGTFNFVAFDTPPGLEGGIDEMLLQLATRCDLVIICTEASRQSFRHVADFVQKFSEADVMSRVLFNRVPQGKVLEEARAVLSNELGDPEFIFQTAIHSRNEIGRYQGQGLCPCDHPSYVGYSEFEALWKEVKLLLPAIHAVEAGT